MLAPCLVLVKISTLDSPLGRVARTFTRSAGVTVSGSRRVGYFGDYADQLPVKVVRPVPFMMRPVPGDRHGRAVSAASRTVTFPS